MLPKEKEFLFKGVTPVQFDPPKVWPKSDLLVRGSQIAEISESIKSDKAEIIEGTGKILFPGLVNAHHHMYSGLARGIMAPVGPTPDFISVLKNLWWRLDRGIDRDILKSSVKICCLDALKCGTTALIDHHSSPSFITGSLQLIKEVMEEIGIRGALCYEVTHRNGAEGAEEGIQENIDFALSLDSEKERKSSKGLIESYIGGHAVFTLSEEILAKISQAVSRTERGFHVHIAEDAYDAAHSHHLLGEDLLPRLLRHGLLSDKTLLAHGTHLEPHEINLINKYDAFLVHNATSNMNNHVGYTSQLWNVKNLALGTDGIGADMFSETGTAYFKHKDAGGLRFPGDYLTCLSGGNRILERLFGKKFGVMEPGGTADLVLADYDPPTPLHKENLGGHFIFGMGQGVVNTVMVNGEILLRNGQFLNDTAPVYKDAREQAARLWKNMETLK